MKKLILIGIGVIFVVVVFGVAGYAYVQAAHIDPVNTQPFPESQPKDCTEYPCCRGDWSRGSCARRIGGGFDAFSGFLMDLRLERMELGLLHGYMWSAVAEIFDLTDPQIEAFEMVQETTKEIRANLTEEEIQEKMSKAVSIAVDNAWADGRITDAQAESLLEYGKQMDGIAPIMPFRGRGMSCNRWQLFSSGVKFGRQILVNHKYLDIVIADMLNISVEEFQKVKAEQGFNLRAYAEEQGMNNDELKVLRMDILSNAINEALDDGAITQDQANLAFEYLENIERHDTWFNQP